MENIQKIKDLCNELYCTMYDEVKERYHCASDVIGDAFRGVDELIKDLEIKANVEKLSHCAVYEKGTSEYDLLSNLDEKQWANLVELLAINGYEPSYNTQDDVFVVR